MNRPENGPADFLAPLDAWLEDYRPGPRLLERGEVESVGDGIAWISGLPSVGMDELVELGDGSRAVVFDLTTERVGAVLLYQTGGLTAGTPARRSRLTLSIPVGDALLGRVVDPVGQPLDEQPVPACEHRRPLDVLSPSLLQRDFVKRPLYTGIRIVDTMIPIGKGQRQLIVGDEGLGRSSIALDTVINQRGRGVRCVYVLVRQKRSAAVSAIETLRRFQALDYTTLVVGEASALPGLQYLAPFAGCAIAEEWMAAGHDTLVVYDDLSNHARAYRELSLLLRRPPGREAYPGDIFFLHARLLERATCLAPAHGGGSMTALAVVETQQGEIAAYIPTNLISITDGQIYLDQELFAAGFRPAVDIARSVSRIGGKAQHPRIKEEAGRMKLDYLQFLELEVFTRFGARLEAGMEARIRHGRVLREALKQDRLDPWGETAQLAWLVAINAGLFDAASPQEIPGLLAKLREAARTSELTLEQSHDDWLATVSGSLGIPVPAADPAP
ncbi:MAG TPA: F0F1 ATP synthase subunit alpha [Gammaproteobacteria bacterium]|nr:F0F1 ATP synthase subunit alpha [Gammaproteobacteria bacterium]